MMRHVRCISLLLGRACFLLGYLTLSNAWLPPAQVLTVRNNHRRVSSLSFSKPPRRNIAANSYHTPSISSLLVTTGDQEFYQRSSPRNQSLRTRSSSFSRRDHQRSRNIPSLSYRNRHGVSLLEHFQSAREVEAWIKKLVEESNSQEVNSEAIELSSQEPPDQVNNTRQSSVPSSPFPLSWTSRDETDFVRLLRDRGAYHAIPLYVQNFVRHHNVFTTTAALAAVASCPNSMQRHHSINVLLQYLDDQYIQPTSYTLVALFQSVDGPVAAQNMMKQLQERYGICTSAWTEKVYHQAIYACGRPSPTISTARESSQQPWQAALDIFHRMRQDGRARITLATYTALLQVCATTGQISIAMSLLQEVENTPGLYPNAKMWDALLRTCAEVGNYQMAMSILQRMVPTTTYNHNGSRALPTASSGAMVNLRHCSAFLKALARSGMDRMSLWALDMMMGVKRNSSDFAMVNEYPNMVQLPLVAPDLVALNTVLASCSKAENYDDAKMLLDRMKTGEFIAPQSGKVIYPDEISYSMLLSACRDPMAAKAIVREMRLSRRRRVGVVVPTNITYARAIAVCRKADTPDVETARHFLQIARQDGIHPTMFMYSASIWTAAGCGDQTAAFAFFSEMKSLGVRPNTICYNGVISSLAMQRQHQQAVEVYREMRENGLPASVATYSLLVASLDGYEEEKRMALLEEIFESMDKDSARFADVGGPVFEALILSYGKEGRYDDAMRVFDKMEGPTNSPCLRAILFACGTAVPPRWEEALALLHASDITSDAIGPGGVDQGALSNAIIACAKADQWEEGINLLQLYGAPATTPRRSNALSVVAFNALIAACGRGHHPEISLNTLNAMESQFGVKPDGRSYRNTVIALNQAEHRRCSKFSSSRTCKTQPLQWWECALSLLRRMQESGLTPDIQTFSSCISACEAAGQWQRALGLLQTMIDAEAEADVKDSQLNLFCFNSAISSCEKGGAWVEALDIYERMLSHGGLLTPTFVTLSSLVLALSKAGQKELAQSKYEEAVKLKIVNPWRMTKDAAGLRVKAMDLHRFNAAMGNTAIRSFLESLLRRRPPELGFQDLIVIVGKGRRSAEDPVLLPRVQHLLQREYRITPSIDATNSGRLIIESDQLESFVSSRQSWR